MTPQRWQQVKEAVAAVLEDTREHRPARLAAACGGDTELRREVQSLLAQERAGSPGMLEACADALAGRLWHELPDAMLGRRIGAYRVLRKIGAGGMGAVYLGHREDRQYEKQVAIKLIKRGMDTDAIVRRFHAERQILAYLEHPNFARLCDGGTTGDGLPYFIMEYVDGVPITGYADARGLDTAERLRLFRAVCGAVHFAHQRLVIHRDIKPGNILVTPEGVPKLLDFGVAKLLDPGAAHRELTATGARPLTLAYASPEQVRGGAVTTATDVYSLGVLLYELLAGRPPHPFREESAYEVERIIREEEPPRPSQVATRAESPRAFLRLPWRPRPAASVRATRRQLRGDLDNIVLMAMRKEPERRYASVAELAADVDRSLAGEPVRARKDTLGYRTRRLLARNKTATAAAALVLLALLGGSAATAWQAHVAGRERARAERRFNDVRRLANSFLFELDGEIERGPTGARKLLVLRAGEYLDSLAREAAGDRTLQRELASSYQKLGDVQSRLNGPNVGDTAGALRSYRQALRLHRFLFETAGGAADPDLRLALSADYHRLGDMLSKTGHMAEALESYRRSIPLLENAAGPGRSRSGRLQLVSSYIFLGRALVRTGDLDGGAAQYARAQAMLDPLAGGPPDDAEVRAVQTALDQSRGFLAALRGHWPEALQDYQRNLALQQSAAAAAPADATVKRTLMDSHEWVGIALRECGDTAGALVEHQCALELCAQALAADPTNVQANNDAADVLHEIGNTLLRRGDAAGALQRYRDAARHYATVASADAVNVHVQRQQLLVAEEMADATAAEGRVAEALAMRAADLPGFERLKDGDPANTEFQRDTAICLLTTGEEMTAAGDAARAEPLLQRALPLLERLAARSPRDAVAAADVARLYLALGRAADRAGRESDAQAWCRRSWQLWQTLQKSETLAIPDRARLAEAAAALR